MADVFISYAREDRDWVERLADVLERAGLSVWWDSRQRYGKSFEAQIVEELGLAKSVVVVWSKASLASDWVKDEAQDGRERGILLPILKDGVLPPLGFKQLHSADFTGWNGGPHKELAGVVDALRDLAGHADRTVAITARPRPAMPAPLPESPQPAPAPKPAPAPIAEAKPPARAPTAQRGQPRLLGRLLSTMNKEGAPAAEAGRAAPTERRPAPAPKLAPAGWRFEPAAVLTGHDGAVTAADVSVDAALAATAAADGTARLWDARTGRQRTLLAGHGAEVTVVQLSNDGERVVTGSQDTDGRLWACADGDLLAILSGHTGTVRNAVFSPDGVRLVTVAEDDMPWLWDARSGAALTTLQGHDDIVCNAAFAPGGGTLATCARDATARIWNAKTGRSLHMLKGHAKGIVEIAYAPDGKSLATGGTDGAVRLWDAGGGGLLHRLDGHGDGITACLFRPDGMSLFTAARDGTGIVWNVATGAHTALLRQQGHTVCAAFAPDGVLVTGHSDGALRLWDKDGQPRAALPAQAASIRSVAFAGDGNTLITASDDKTARLWRVVRG